jgi:hypothetical protein
MDKPLVIITKGPYKGYLAYYQGETSNKGVPYAYLFICSNGKFATVASGDIIPAPAKYNTTRDNVVVDLEPNVYTYDDQIYIDTTKDSPTTGYFDFLQAFNPFRSSPTEETQNQIPFEFEKKFDTVHDLFENYAQEEKKAQPEKKKEVQAFEYLDEGSSDMIPGYNEHYNYVNEIYNPNYIVKNYSKEDQEKVLIIKDTLETIFNVTSIEVIDDSLGAIFSHTNKVLEIINGNKTNKGLKQIIAPTKEIITNVTIAYMYYYINNTGITSRINLNAKRMGCQLQIRIIIFLVYF